MLLAEYRLTNSRDARNITGNAKRETRRGSLLFLSNFRNPHNFPQMTEIAMNSATDIQADKHVKRGKKEKEKHSRNL